MSTNKTQNYNLHSWVPEDDFLRSEFNDNFTSLDTALKSLSTALAAETTAREQAVSAEAQARAAAISTEQNTRAAAIAALTTSKAEIVTGAYSGDKTTGRVIDLGFQPRAVLVANKYGRMGFFNDRYSVSGGLALPGHPVVAGSYASGEIVALEIVSNGFRVTHDGYSLTNDERTDYYYIAVK